jgi:hypothetical protein
VRRPMVHPRAKLTPFGRLLHVEWVLGPGRSIPREIRPSVSSLSRLPIRSKFALASAMGVATKSYPTRPIASDRICDPFILRR